MPGFTTHYLFGMMTYKSLHNDSLKKIIFDHHAAYSLGLQGPDLFFYYPRFAMRKGDNPGSVSHKKDTVKFFSYLIDSRNLFPDKKEAEIAQAYIMGFLGHYLLDCSCHPYIYYRTHYVENSASYLGTHMNLETDIDTELLSFFKHKMPSSFRQNSTIMLTRLEVRTIATLLYYVYSMTYPDLKVSYTDMRLAIRSIQTGTRLLYDPHGKKKVLVRKVESFTPGYPVLSPMVASDSIQFFADPLNTLRRTWRNPWKTEQASCDSFLELFETAQADYRKLLPKLHRFFQSKRHSETANLRYEEILNLLGNRSYHSGLPINSDI